MAGAIELGKVAKEDMDLGIGSFMRPAPLGGSMLLNQVNLGSFALRASMTYDPGLVTPGIAVAQDVTVPGALTHFPALMSFTGNTDHSLLMYAYVVAPDTVRVVIHNLGAVPFNPGSGTLRVLVFRIS